MTFSQPEPIAIVGSGCRFPGSSSSPSALWKLLEKPRDVSKAIPDDRFELKAYYHTKGSHHGTTNVQRAYILNEDVRVFDAKFFNLSPNEADSMDPQQRILLETVYEALEAGGHSIESLRGSDTAVYVGTMSVDYNDIIMRDIDSTPTYFSTGTSRAILANRISYFFDWHGPSMSIDTACSSSMVALHQSVKSLRLGESRVAIAGGTELLLGPEQFVGESKMNLLSPTGQSRMWDADANGYARGDGIAAVVLKKLSDAIADGDHIECLIRETGVNQDGKSNGITVPSSEAQASLIKGTYARAGLDISNSKNWPQFFEAHGTGTKVGDPREAAAIQATFGSESVNGNPLYVGSIKTIIGHTEGTAGLAGVLKASLAIQHGIIPPNMLLNRLNPDVQQYYTNLHIPTTAIQWPMLPKGVPRRASVNSFGFGGTNGHAILESYQPSTNTVESLIRKLEPLAPFTPFTFSAVTDESLVTLLQNYSDFLKSNNSINLCDLAWTLQSRKSALQAKTAFSASTIQGLVSKIDKKLEQTESTPGTKIGVRSNHEKPRLLGVFTGQGAQYATMLADLIRSSVIVREKIEELDISLANLPEEDRPSWRIGEQLLLGKEVSRLGEAALSQPLCTAIQVVLVDLLRSAGITFERVIGHSSGEIGAAYAANFISAHDAIRIAYYRGMYAKLAEGTKGQQGAMMAVGTSWEDAEELINLPAFKGRIKIAAHNSAASLTLSGDLDGITHAKKVFDEEKKFARMLLVDTAYHSHHMFPCGERYTEALRRCGIQVNQKRNKSCSWFSSVKPGELMEPIDELCDTYWRDNMLNTVLFADAVASAASKEELNLAIEVGPHPALKGPVQQTVADVRPSPLPYTGVLSRGTNDVEAFSDALGFVWTELGPGAVDFQSYSRLVAPSQAPKLIVGLPSYQWNHERIHWHESRLAKKMRLRGAAFHELLGVPSPNNTDRDLRWTNYLKANEIPWLDGHQLQGQTIFPAAGYVAIALEAGKVLAGTRNVKVFEVHNLTIGKAIAFDEGADFAAETLVTLTDITPNHPDMKTQTASFAVYSCPNTGSVDLELVSSGKVNIIYGTPSFSTLSSSPLDDSNMTAINSDSFYSSLVDLGYGYNGPFKTLSSTKRSFEKASAMVSTYGYNDDDDTLIVHPTMLDVAFQASFLAQSSPGDEQLWSLHVPTSIKCIRVNPELCASLPTSVTNLPLSAVLHEPDSNSISMRSSVDIFSEDGQQTILQVEDLIMKPFSPATAANDRPMFSTIKYGIASPDGNASVGNDRPTAEAAVIAVLCERLAYYYLRKWKLEITDGEWESGEGQYRSLRQSMNQLLSAIDSGLLASVKKEWNVDSYDEIKALMSKYPENIDLKLISTIGENIPAAVRGHSSIPEHMLDDLYNDGLGFAQYNTFLGRMMKQVSHRYPHAKILEIGARSGHATKAILKNIGSTLSSYTYTNNSTEFFEKAAESFKMHSQKMSFKVFDTEDTPSSQEFEEHSYDIVIASNALHNTSFLQETLENIRRLLKPGGYLLVSGITKDNHTPLRIQTMLGSLSDWSVDVDDGHKKSSTTTATWHSTLRKSGFSGIDTITPEVDGVTWPFSVIAAQAVDEQIDFLRKPLSAPSSVHLDNLVILGNGSPKTTCIAEEISELARKFCDKVTILEGLPTENDEIAPMTTFINLVDLVEPIFKNITEETMSSLKVLFELSNNILWVTEGARADEPYHNASIGFGRSIAYEMPHLSLQFLDLGGDVGGNASRLIIESVLRLAAMDQWNSKGNLHKKLLWAKEPELYLEDGQLSVPRILPNVEQNARINSLRRPVTKIVNPQNSTVSISQTGDRLPTLREESIPQNPRHQETCVQVNHSTFATLNVCPETFLFLGSGTDEATGDAVITLSDANSSKITSFVSVSANNVPGSQVSGFLAATASELLAASLISRLSTNSHVLVHDPDQDGLLASALARQAAVNNIHVTFSTSKSGVDDLVWIKLDPWTSKHIVKKSIPAKLTHYLDLATDDEGKQISCSIRKCLPSGCKQIKASDLFGCQSTPSSNDGSVLKALENAVSRAKTTEFVKIPSATIRSGQIEDASVPKFPTSIVDWTLDKNLTLHVQPIDPMFSSDKTYLLVGLGTQLGQSICEWMSRNGAGYVCLTSRSPKCDEKWQASMKKAGTVVKFFAMDVTKKQDLAKVVDEIKETFPPIAGVANGAAVFYDELFSEMSLETMEKVTKPKIDGTKYLDEFFSETELDFFIVFSSLTSVIGNAGQSNYTAANAYMTGLVGQRRKRGLAGTSLDIGRIAGIGYMERAGDIAREQLIKYGFMAISERDLHQLLAEAIRAGSPDSGADPVVTTGCRTVRDDEEPRVAWFEDPRFSHKVSVETQGGASQGGKIDGKKSALPVRDQLADATTTAEALDILKDCFAAKLAMISRLADGQVGHNIPLIELGIDSLVAVEVRGWFLKELKTDMPVLKVLGGGSVADLCQQALEKLPEGSLPNIGVENSSRPKAAEPIRKATPKAVPESLSASSTGKGFASPTGERFTSQMSERFTSQMSERFTWSFAETSPGSHSPRDTPMTPLSSVYSSDDLTADVEETSKPQPHEVD